MRVSFTLGVSAASERLARITDVPGDVGFHFQERRLMPGMDEQGNGLRIAYADPPYPGRSARHYRNHPDFGGEVDHAALVAQLDEYDGWALSTGAHALRDVLALCPPGPGVRVACWYKTNAEPPLNKAALWHYSWEPVIVKPARARKDVRDVLCAGAPMGVLGGTLKGQKPRAFCEWLFALLGAERFDSFDDLFVGSGAVTDAWARWRSQGSLLSEVSA